MTSKRARSETSLLARIVHAADPVASPATAGGGASAAGESEKKSTTVTGLAKLPTSILTRVVCDFLGVWDYPRLGRVDKRARVLMKRGQITVTNAEFDKYDVVYRMNTEERLAFGDCIPVWSTKTKRLKLGEEVISACDWWGAAPRWNFEALETLIVSNWQNATQHEWRRLMQGSPRLHRLRIARMHVASNDPLLSQEFEGWTVEPARKWTFVRIQLENERVTPRLYHVFANPKLENIVLMSYLKNEVPWSLDDVRQLLSKLSGDTVRVLHLCGRPNSQDADAILLLLARTLPNLDAWPFSSGNNTVRLTTVETLLAMWSFLTELPLPNVESTEGYPRTMTLPASRAWTKLHGSEASGFGDWRIADFVRLIQTSERWEEIWWDVYTEANGVMDAKQIDAVLRQLKAPLHYLYLFVPCAPNAANLQTLGELVQPMRNQPYVDVQFGPEFTEFRSDTPPTDLTTQTLLDCGHDIRKRPPFTGIRLSITWVPVQLDHPNAVSIMRTITWWHHFAFWITSKEAEQLPFSGTSTRSDDGRFVFIWT